MTTGTKAITIEVPFTIRKRGGRKEIITPDGVPYFAPPRLRVDNSFVKALARAFRWRRMLENGTYGTIKELAKAEKIHPTYLARVLRLTLLAPDIIEAILDGRQPEGMTLSTALADVPDLWSHQRAAPSSRLPAAATRT